MGFPKLIATPFFYEMVFFNFLEKYIKTSFHLHLVFLNKQPVYKQLTLR